MLIRDKKSFLRGAILAISFWALLLVIMSPVFDGKNGLEYADNIFNKLAKGSSYFVPELNEKAEEVMDEQISLALTYDTAEEVQRVSKILSLSGATVVPQESTLTIEGSLGKILATAIRDADWMYYNQGEKVRNIYGYDEKQVLKDWWNILQKMGKGFEKKEKFEDAALLSAVNKKVIEAAYNFYQIEPVKVSQRTGTMSALLGFYVLYTLWWGFALMYLVEGMGLTLKKKGARKEE